MSSFIETPFFQKIYTCNCILISSQYYISPYNVTLDPGYYKVELWGASGGGKEGLVGKGGYAKAFFNIVNSTDFYIFVGGQGLTSYDSNALGGCNGGGNGYKGKNDQEGTENGGGGGSTDIRTSIFDINSRILVASGGGGSGLGFFGGDGGAEIGFNGSGWWTDGKGTQEWHYTNGTGGTQDEGGKGGYYKNYHADNGDLLFGLNAVGYGFSSGGSGGGYYGGGGAYESGGGGGSGYIDKSLVGSLKFGKDRFPSPNKKGYEIFILEMVMQKLLSLHKK